MGSQRLMTERLSIHSLLRRGLLEALPAALVRGRRAVSGLEAQGSKYQTQTIPGDFGGRARGPWVTRSCPHPGLMVPVPFSG